MLVDLVEDPQQFAPIQKPEIEDQFCLDIVEEMKRHDAPTELYDRFDLPSDRWLYWVDLCEKRRGGTPMEITKIETCRYSGDTKSTYVAEIVVVRVFTDGDIFGTGRVQR